MRKAIIPHDAFVFIGDGRKALFLRPFRALVRRLGPISN